MCRVWSRRGFTLIEMLISMIILAIIIGIGIPSYVSFRDAQRMEAVGQTLISDLQLARTEAGKTSDRTIRIYLFSGTNWCWRVADTACTSCSDTCTLGSDHLVRGSSVSDFPNTSMDTHLATTNQLLVSGRRGVMVGDGSDWVRFSLNGKQVEVHVSATGNARLCTPSGTQLSGIESCS